MQQVKAAINYHENLAGQWDARYCSGTFLKRAKFFRTNILPHLPPGGTWLDAGCGSGYFSRILATNSAIVTGIDGSEKMLQQATAIAASAEHKGKIHFEKIETIEKLHFEDGSFDGCVCLSVLEYLPNPNLCLSELVRILKPDGFLVISVPHRFSAIRQLQHLLVRTGLSTKSKALDYLDVSNFTVSPKSLERLLSNAGMKLIYQSGFDTRIPAALHTILPPSLIYAIAVKK